jgi:hypothetical protein
MKMDSGERARFAQEPVAHRYWWFVRAAMRLKDSDLSIRF